MISSDYFTASEQADILQFGSFVDHGLQLSNIRLLTRAAPK
jgi:hypothetical protein